MLVVERELVLDLTEEGAEDYKDVLKRAIDTVLNREIHEFTLVSHLTRRFWVTDLTQILRQTNNLRVLSLFSVALTGSVAEFADFGKALRRHQELIEVHMVDCGMLGNWEGQSTSDASTSTGTPSTQGARKKPAAAVPGGVFQKPSNPTPSTTSKTTLSTSSKTGPPTAASAAASVENNSVQMASVAGTSMATRSVAESSAMEASKATPSKVSASKAASKLSIPVPVAGPGTVASSVAGGTVGSVTGSKASDAKTSDSKSTVTSATKSTGPPTPTLDVILNALATIKTLENVELYGIPGEKFDKSSDGDQESGHQVMVQEDEGEADIPMVPMGEKDSITFSDGDFMNDYDEDIRGIPGKGRVACSITKKLSMLMSPDSMARLCRCPNLLNLGFEDLNLKPAHVKLLAEAFSAKGHKIQELKLYGCNIDDKGALSLARMLAVNKTLEKLDLSYNHIGDEGCRAIAAALRDNEVLRSLNLMGNECAETYDMVSEGGCYEALLELLEKNKVLKDLILEPFEQDDSSDCVPEFIIIPNNKSPEEVSSASDED